MSAEAITTNLCDLITALPSPAIPTTTLTAPAAAGSLALSLTPCLDSSNRSRIREGSRLRFLDGLGEILVTVNSVDTSNPAVTAVTLESVPALGFTGLAHTHAAGITVTANLVDYPPFEASAMLALGDPVITVTVRKVRQRRDVMPSYGFPPFAVHIQSDYRLNRPSEEVDPESWARHCYVSTLATLEAIDEEIRQNQELTTPFSDALAIQLGDLNGHSDVTALDVGAVPYQNGDVWHYVGTLDFIVTGNAE